MHTVVSCVNGGRVGGDGGSLLGTMHTVESCVIGGRVGDERDERDSLLSDLRVVLAFLRLSPASSRDNILMLSDRLTP